MAIRKNGNGRIEIDWGFFSFIFKVIVTVAAIVACYHLTIAKLATNQALMEHRLCQVEEVIERIPIIEKKLDSLIIILE
jgi:hypothetical protein